jgi:hypothetical protein
MQILLESVSVFLIVMGFFTNIAVAVTNYTLYYDRKQTIKWVTMGVTEIIIGLIITYYI